MANRIKELRTKHGLTLKQVAEVANTTYQQINRLEKSDRRLTDDWMHRLAPAFHCPPAALMKERKSRRRQALDRNALSIAVREVLWCIERLEETMAEQEVVLRVLRTYRRYQDENVGDRDKFSEIAKEVVDGN